MKQIFLSLFLAFSAVGIYAQQVKEVVGLKETAFDFGKIQQGRPATHVFRVENLSADTLHIQNVQASCGCTTPVWKKDPVEPGGTAEINVGYNAAAEGAFEKQVTVYYNGGQTKTLTIKGDVYRMPSTPAPPNAGIQLLKQTNQ